MGLIESEHLETSIQLTPRSVSKVLLPDQIPVLTVDFFPPIVQPLLKYLKWYPESKNVKIPLDCYDSFVAYDGVVPILKSLRDFVKYDIWEFVPLVCHFEYFLIIKFCYFFLVIVIIKYLIYIFYLKDKILFEVFGQSFLMENKKYTPGILLETEPTSVQLDNIDATVALSFYLEDERLLTYKTFVETIEENETVLYDFHIASIFAKIEKMVETKFEEKSTARFGRTMLFYLKPYRRNYQILSRYNYLTTP